MNRHYRLPRWFLVVGLGWLALVDPNRVEAQLTPEQMADMILASARKAYNEKNHGFAVQRFREFIGKFGNHKEITSARHGLALALLETPERNLQEVRDLFQNLANQKDFPEQALAQYYLGLTLRAQGVEELRQGEARPNEMPQRRQAAQQRFEEAGKVFAAVLPLLEKKAGPPVKDARELTVAWEWAARARCDLAEMLLRTGKFKECQVNSEAFAKDPSLTKSRYRDQGRYYHGFASFQLKDYAAAQKSLSMLAPFTEPELGPHARYILARTHHLAEERAEALLHYEGAANDYQKAKALAVELLKQPDKLKNDPVEKQRLENFVKSPAPDYVARSMFYLGVLLYEAGKFGEAKARFVDFPKLVPQSPLKLDAEIRVGFCQVQLKEFAEAMKTLQPLIDRDPRLSDQVLFWLGKAQVGAAPDPATALPAYQQALNAALNLYRQAADRAQRIQDQDPEARQRRGDVLLEIADTQQLLKQPRDAVNTYTQVINEKLLPTRDEELNQRLIAAWHLVGDYNESDKACQAFIQRYPKSVLIPSVLFSFAENNYFRMVAAEKNPNVQVKAKELAALYPETIKRFQTIIDKYPEFPKVHLARYSLGLTHYRQGELDKARKTLETIPAADRTGELALVPYVMADCLIRLAPRTVEDDALAVGKLEEQLKSAADLLEGFVSGVEPSSETADASIKLGICQQRLAGLMSQPAEKAKVLASARATYERLINTKQLTNHPLQTQAIFERAKVLAQQNEVGNAINELRRFTNDPLKNSLVAPLAAVQLATYLRGQNNPKEAAAVLAKARETFEPKLANDQERQGWIALLRFHHAAAQREAGQLNEARVLYQQVAQQFASRAEGMEAALRFGQCLKDEGEQKIDQARKLQTAAKKPEETAQVQKTFDEGLGKIREAAAYLENQANALKTQTTLQDVRARMIYESAWAQRVLAEAEIRAARQMIQKDLIKKLGPPEKVVPPDVPLSKIPIQPSEKKARELYRTLIDAFADLPLAVDGRFELSELLADRGEIDAAKKLLDEALDKEPNPDLSDKIRLRMGAVQAAKGNIKAAIAQFEAITNNKNSKLHGWAHYRAGEALLQNQQYPEAIKRLTLFRDNGQFNNLPGIADRALLRLGHAYALSRSWEESRQAYERLTGAFPNSPLVDEARYGMGWAQQQQKNYDGAVNTYQQVTQRTAAEVGAKAQLQIGLCRLEQQRYQEAANALLVVPFTYDYPELSAVALLEAARAFSEGKQPAQARKLLDRVLRDFAGTPYAEAAKERLDNIKK